MGLPDEKFYVSPETRSYFAEHKEKLKAAYEEWKSSFEAWKKANGDLAAELEAVLSGKTPDLLSVIPNFDPAANIATRKAGSEVLQPVAQAMPLVISGSADLHGSTLNYIKDGGDFNAKNRGGRNLFFGIREHAMCGILNGLAYDGIFRPSGATFLVFSDYASSVDPSGRDFPGFPSSTFSRMTRSVSAKMARPMSPWRLSPHCGRFRDSM